MSMASTFTTCHIFKKLTVWESNKRAFEVTAVVPAWRWFFERICCHHQWQRYGAVSPKGRIQGNWGIKVEEVLLTITPCDALSAAGRGWWWCLLSLHSELRRFKDSVSKREISPSVDRTRIKLYTMAATQLIELCAKGPAGKERRHHPGRWLTDHQEEVQLLPPSKAGRNILGIKAVVCQWRFYNLFIRACSTPLFPIPV